MPHPGRSAFSMQNFIFHKDRSRSFHSFAIRLVSGYIKCGLMLFEISAAEVRASDWPFRKRGTSDNAMQMILRRNSSTPVRRKRLFSMLINCDEFIPELFAGRPVFSLVQRAINFDVKLNYIFFCVCCAATY